MSAVFLTRVVLKNYKSIAHCDVRLGPLTYLVGINGAGKSNFLDALKLVGEALRGSLDNALNERGGLSEVRRRSSGHPTHFGIRLEFRLPSGKTGYYVFNVGALKGGGYEVQNEECVIGKIGRGPFYQVERGVLRASSEETFPALTSDRLALVSVSGLQVFRPVYDALTAMGFYNLSPKVIQDLQKPQDGRLLKSAGENIASVLAHLERVQSPSLPLIKQYLHRVVPTISDVQRVQIGPMETLEFRQEVAGAQYPWRFQAPNMSDGTLRALGVLMALFQGHQEHQPTVIGIEEPETALHPAASAVLRDALQRASEHTQLIVTSHSPELLDDPTLEPESLLFVTSQEGDSRIVPIDEASRHNIKQHLFTPGELLRLNQLEGDTDALAQMHQRQPDLFGDMVE